MLTVSSDEIRCRVEKLRRQFQTSDPFILCRQLDVQLKGVNFGETEHSIKAMTTVIFRIRMIQYNSNLPRTLLTFILAHERDTFSCTAGKSKHSRRRKQRCTKPTAWKLRQTGLPPSCCWVTVHPFTGKCRIPTIRCSKSLRCIMSPTISWLTNCK